MRYINGGYNDKWRVHEWRVQSALAPLINTSAKKLICFGKAINARRCADYESFCSSNIGAIKTQLRRFIAQVIDPDSGTSRAPPDKLHSIVTLAHSSNPSHTAAVQYDVFPVFDENGIQVAFQRVPRKIAQPSSTATANPTHLQSSNYSSKPQAEVNIIKPEKNWRDLPAFDLSNPAPQTSFIPLDPQPSSSSSLDDGIIATSLEQLPGGIWDPWANGRFYINLSHLEYSQNKQLGVHWATKNNSSQNGKGSTNSSYLDGGKITNKKCLGVVTCSGEDYDFVYRPRVSPENLAKQLENPCANCSASLIHVPCNSRSYLIRYGQLGNDTSTLKYRYINGSPHNHSRIPNVTRTTATEDIKFLAAYQSRPDATPSQMMAGPPAPTGFGPGAAEIGHKFRSQGYTGYSLRRLRAKDGNGPSSAFGFFTKLGDWKKLHPDVLCQDFTSSTINCLSLQTEWMRQQTLPDMTQVDEPLHGILSDAAHKYWEDPNGRLIVSSIFSPLINKWIPILFTYANGATTAHYEYHFLVLIQGIVRTALECSIAITDDLFVGVVDFSDPQRIGFVEAFVSFFLADADNLRTEPQLRNAAAKLLKGCHYHFQKSVTRMAHIGAIIPHESKQQFKNLCSELTTVVTQHEFNAAVAQLRERWPKTSHWLTWWLAPDHARMIFPSQQTMSPELAAQLPDTTNAEEAMHATIYRVVGSLHNPLFRGLDGLLNVEKGFRRDIQSAQLNIKTYYGKSGLQIRKDLFERFGTTHPSRKNPRGEARERRTGRGEGNPPFKAATGSRSLAYKSGKEPEADSDSDSSYHPSSSSQVSKHSPVPDLTLLNTEKEESHSCVDSSDSESQKGYSNARDAKQKVELMSPSKLQPGKPMDDFRPIVLASTKSTPSAKWDNNSCWLDASVEVYFIAMAFYNCFRDFQSLVGSEEGHDRPSLIFYLCKFFGFRLQQGLSRNDAIGEISNIRDNFRKFLFSVQAVTGALDDYQTAFGWMQHLLTPSTPFPRNSSCVEYFSARTLEVWKCEHSMTKMAHLRLKEYQKPLGWSPLLQDWKYRDKGSIQSWFNQMAIVEKADKAVHLVPGCWRQESQDDVITGVCAGKSRQIQFLVDLPVLLNIVSDYQAGKAWTFPLELYIGSKSAAIRQGLVYDLVGVVLSNGNHFTTLTAIPTTSNSKAVFAYDGMTNGGFSKYIPGKPAALMTGLHPSGAPTGFHVHAVLYKLRGGLMAKQMFQTSQAAIVKKRFSISLQNPSPPVFTESDWIQIISGSTSFSEYNHTSSSLDIPTALMTQTTIPRNFIDLSKPNFNVTDSIPTPLSSPGQQVKSSSPPPSSPQPIHCRCGIQADGHREAVVQVTVQCDRCDNYTHVACLTSRLRDELPKNFICHICDVNKADRFPEVVKKLPNLRMQLLKTVEKRLFPGKGVLVKIGPLYYYPGRLIFKDLGSSQWTVEMWRGIHNENAGKILNVTVSNIVDGLWKDAAGRRTLQMNCCLTGDLSNAPHALDPHKKILLDLSTTPSTDTRFATFSNTKIPALSYQPSKNSQYPSATNPTLYRGGLLDTDLAGIRNWFFEHLGSKTIAELEFHHLLDYSIAHARTLLLAFRHRNAFASSNESYDSEEILLKAWNRLQEWNGLTVDGSLPHQEGADVNLEAITLLDKIMFDESKRAGVAGNHQWGLDKGPHEAGIDPQLVGPRVTQENERREGDDDIEIVFGPNYTGGVVAETNVPDEQKPSPKRPRPRPITKRKALDAEISQDKRQKRQKTDDAEDSDVEMK
ncbi:hypothetical protein D9757_009228 [Collybiopsis confluens]|uniref:Zinc finger PHD-type domain-containing protein n=1 Tax=Collybiopsis confluens TaxID=2823264 RepID=A0A8H5HAG2_9AGAR|nr:hypothetical protein D9757_009228 [Collybiopsis confluens]